MFTVDIFRALFKRTKLWCRLKQFFLFCTILILHEATLFFPTRNPGTWSCRNQYCVRKYWRHWLFMREKRFLPPPQLHTYYNNKCLHWLTFYGGEEERSYLTQKEHIWMHISSRKKVFSLLQRKKTTTRVDSLMNENVSFIQSLTSI